MRRNTKRERPDGILQCSPAGTLEVVIGRQRALAELLRKNALEDAAMQLIAERAFAEFPNETRTGSCARRQTEWFHAAVSMFELT